MRERWGKLMLWLATSKCDGTCDDKCFHTHHMTWFGNLRYITSFKYRAKWHHTWHRES